MMTRSNRAKRIIAILLSCVLLIPTVFTTTAIEESPSNFEGRFITKDSEAEEVDLSQIEVEVYQSIPKPKVAEDYVEYEETYLYSVYSDTEGKFSFEIPNQTFSITVALDSLPSGLGIEQQSRLYHSDAVSDTFGLYKVADANMTVTALDAEPEVTLLAKDGTQLLADYSFAYSFEPKNDDVVSYSGVVRLQDNTVLDTSTDVDLSGMSFYEKNEQLYLSGIIDEEERMLEVASFLSGTDAASEKAENHRYEVAECGTMMIDLLAEYKESGRYEAASDSVKHTIDGVIEKKPSVTATGNLGYNTSDKSEVMSTTALSSKSNAYFTVYYESTVPEATATQVLKFLTSMRSKALAENFKLPRLETGKSTLQIYLYSASNSARGLTYPVEYKDGTAASYIEIWGITSWSAEWGETLAHEYFHAVQNAYLYYSNWFKESTSVWFAAKYANSIERAGDKFDKYFNNCNLGLEDDGNQYGSGVFPMAIDVVFGGSATIRKIYENLDIHNAEINKSMLRDDIASAIRSNDSTGSFERAFEITSAYITFPGHFYRTIIPSGVTWENGKKANGTSTYTANLSSYGCKPVKYVATSSTPKTMSIIINYSGTASATKTSARVVFQSNSGTITPIGSKTTNSRYTAEITNYGSKGNREIDIVPIYYNSASSCTATISVSYS